MTNGANQKRLIAAQIVLELHQAAELSQLQTLKMQVDASVADLVDGK